MSVRMTVRIRRVFVAGLLVLGPAALTVVVLVWLFRTLDGLLGPVLGDLTGRQIPGLGLVATILIVFLLGIVSRNMLGRRVVSAAERLVDRVPVASQLYSSTKEVVASIADRPADTVRRVVFFEYPRRGSWSVGFVTGSVKGSDLGPADTAPEGDLLTIFVPSTPNPASGYVVLVPREDTVESDMTMEQAVRLVISGGILRPTAWANRQSGGARSSGGASLIAEDATS
jgi:uncharacterized membrane protein